ncbi:DNA-binding transcriptional response regulator, NtrC family, contains REC, AAA-type ATPase, and a Fis-type DNA-binding domains [Flavobacterium aquidurense]|uniref:DNA-binding response regulator n=1 Tax=Flavobacterium frigidimaris TaxID=262320 RepID=A0ABX4BP27_FLAFR|nr:sigma-54 dependent transcriptional regulator [Flavobacterium frigidimaris]OXA78402.1 DNA-binding response regulator [Flavobacterium frigidimaris]SDZ63076.1 DNA-binding transcriptional response regulator, NtrC family, contains REC, AAA-type ATPase, and a Fis-type DNA-binding domains [Flavobacterium aquidurense]
MQEKILIVEDEFIVANDLKIMLVKAGYQITGIASSVVQARKLIESKKPDWVLLDIMLKGDLTGIDLAWELRELQLPFLYISANTNQTTLEAVKATHPYGFMVKPFRERDLIVMLDIARYRFEQEKGSLTTIKIETENQEIDGIIGESQLLKEVIEKIKIVAPAETFVLILGESGTGKERVAHAIHDLSAHKLKPIVVVNCAALPHSLIESELFGHEKGAFTGANTLRIGKFEQANNGTIFLDEIGELPLESQVKLLRVLQEKEIQRLGGNKTIKINVRIVAATNRSLEKEVAEGRFRLDLYYRLNVFPIQLPTLKERREDIEALAHYFLKKFATASRKNVNSIGTSALEQLMQYNWPGNIRELEHLIERNVLLAKTNEIEKFDLPVNNSNPLELNNGKIKSMEEMEKEHIINALKICDGKVSGPGGAAELLKMQPQTLFSKMKKLDIKQGYN